MNWKLSNRQLILLLQSSFFNTECPYYSCAVASWLMRSTPDREVRLSALTGCIVILVKTLDSHKASLHSGVQTSASKYNAGGNPAIDDHPWRRVWVRREGSKSQLSVKILYGSVVSYIFGHFSVKRLLTITLEPQMAQNSPSWSDL